MHRLHEAQRPRSKADRLALSVIYPGSPQVVSKSILAPSTTSTPTVPQGAVTRMRVLENDLGLQEGDVGCLKQLWERLDSLAARAKRNGYVSEGARSYLRILTNEQCSVHLGCRRDMLSARPGRIYSVVINEIQQTARQGRSGVRG